MASVEQLVPVVFSLAAALCWGTSDFSGGYASRRSDSFLVTALSHAGGFVLMLTLALIMRPDLPSRSSQHWAGAAGALGGVALLIFYRALSQGMGLAAPVAAVLGAAIPAAFTMITHGLPGKLGLAGFLLAGLGIWLISRPDGSGNAGGVFIAAVAGIGFAGFFICISRTGDSSPLWSAVFSRVASLLLVGTHRAVPAGAKDRCSVGTQASRSLPDVWTSPAPHSSSAPIRLAGWTRWWSCPRFIRRLTVLLARFFLKEHFTGWKTAGILAAVAAVPLIALQ